MASFYEVEKDRFDLININKYRLLGTWPKGFLCRALLDGHEIRSSLQESERVSALERFQDLDSEGSVHARVAVLLPENLSAFKKLEIMAVDGDSRIRWFTADVKRLLKLQGMPQYFIEDIEVDKSEGVCRCRGWAADKTPVEIRVDDAKHQAMACEIQYQRRADVNAVFDETEVAEKCGFYFEAPLNGDKEWYISFSSSGKTVVHTIKLSAFGRAVENWNTLVKKGVKYLRGHGGRAFAKKLIGKATGKDRGPVPYAKWLPHHLAGDAELERERKTSFPKMPLFSIVVPLYKTPENYLLEMVRSVQAQTYEKWELCLSDGSGSDSPLRDVLQRIAAEDPRIRVIAHEQPLRIAENTNAAIEAAKGDYIAFMDHDDVILPNALFECAKAVNEGNDIRFIYTDEDKMSMDGHKFFQPAFKPDFNIDLLCSVNYICHLTVVSRDLISSAGMLRPEYDGAQDYDFILRCVERLDPSQIAHITRILYHWRSHENSTSENPESKLYAFEAGRRAIQDYYDRNGIPAEALSGEYLGLYRTKYHWQEKPLISILIPNKDHIDDLKRCIESIDQNSTYTNYEFIIIENNSVEQKTFAYYKKTEAENPKVKVVYWDGEFNFSAINNFGAQYAKGDYYLLLNNDTKIINPDCLEELLGYCMRPDVGAVGARLYYEDDTIQHAGVVIGFGGIAGHCFVMQPRGATGYCHRIICACDYSAVTAACCMVKREAFEKAGGFSTELAVAFNDIDLCLKLRREGYLIVYNPYAELYHFESKSRGLEDTPEKVARFNREIAAFEKRWPEILKSGDPYYNPNLTLESQDFSLKRI